MNRDTVAATAILNAVMLCGALAFFAVPVLAPAIATDLFVDTALVGAFSAMLWGSSMITNALAGHLIGRYGPMAMSQACVGFCAVGLAVAALGWIPLFVVAAVLIGLAHGVETPASSAILARLTPLAQQPFVFSVKQTGVQIGGMLAGALYPALALGLGWRTALGVMAGVLALATLAMQAARHRFVVPPHAGPALSFLAAFGLILRDARLRRLSIASFAFVGNQVCFNSFLVAYFVADHRVSLVIAGQYLVAGQVGGLLGRLLWGAIVGRRIGTTRLLALLGVGMVAVSLALGTVANTLSTPLVLALCFAGGLTASGWNGIFLAEIARLAPTGQVARITAASFMIGSAGLVVAPILMSAIAAHASFTAGYAAMAIFAAIGVAALTLRRPI